MEENEKMTGILMTQVSTPIIGQAAWLLGKIMNGIYWVMSHVFGIQNIGVCIIILTIIIYTLLLPFTIKQQKFSKMSAAMAPEIKKIQKKYEGKKDQDSMMKLQEETKLVYAKYGVSPTGGCLTMFIQLPIMYAMWYVIRGIPAYISEVKDIYLPLITQIQATDGWQKIMEGIGQAKPILMSPDKYDYTKTNILVDVLYKFESSTWSTLKESFPALTDVINSTTSQLQHINNFLGLNIAESPATLMKSALAAGSYGILIAAVLIPILSGVTQFISVKAMPQNTSGDQMEGQMAATMKSMNYTLPLVSVFMCFTLPTGLGIYWIASAVIRTIYQILVNKKLDKMPIDELIEKNLEKVEAKREKKNKVQSSEVASMATVKTKNMSKAKSADEQKELEEKIENIRKQNEHAPEGSLASKADMVRKFNEMNK